MVNDGSREREYVEETGKVLENFGLTPMQGRIIAYFLVSDPPEKTFDDLVKYFRASKSSISNSLNYLLQSNIVDYKTYSEDRKRYFHLTELFFRAYFEKVLGNVTELKERLFRTVSMRSPEHPGASEKLLVWIGNANVFEDSLRSDLKQMEKDRY
jgi:DNA-binding transcriptional regulator GbsR (MarR family)